jgi:hypothetical protein
MPHMTQSPNSTDVAAVIQPGAEELQKILERQLELHNQMHGAALDMQNALKAGKTAEVAVNSSRYDACVNQVEELEAKRISMLADIGASLKCPPEQCTVSRIAAVLPAPVAERLSAVRNRLKEKLRDLAGVNLANRIFLEEMLSSIARTFEIIRNNVCVKSAGYSMPGSRQGMSQSMPVINRIA